MDGKYDQKMMMATLGIKYGYYVRYATMYWTHKTQVSKAKTRR